MNEIRLKDLPPIVAALLKPHLGLIVERRGKYLVDVSFDENDKPETIVLKITKMEMNNAGTDANSQRRIVEYAGF